MTPLMEEVREMIGDRPVYLSFDIDSLDPAFAPGTGFLLLILLYDFFKGLRLSIYLHFFIFHFNFNKRRILYKCHVTKNITRQLEVGAFLMKKRKIDLFIPKNTKNSLWMKILKNNKNSQGSIDIAFKKQPTC